MSKLAESRGNRCRLLAKSIGFTAAPEKKTDLGHFSAWGPKTCNSGRGSGSAFLHPIELAKRTANFRLGKSDGFSGTDTPSLGSESFLVFYVFVGGCFFASLLGGETSVRCVGPEQIRCPAAQRPWTH